MADQSDRVSLEASPHAMTRAQLVYVWLAGVYITSLVMANVLGVKLFAFEVSWWPLGRPEGGGPGVLEHTVGMLPFPITFLLTDLLNEYYGKRAARRVAYMAFSMAALAWVLIAAARALPIKEVPGTATQESFENVFGAASLMYLASLAAFLCGSLLDIFIFGVFKRLTGDRLVWVRTTGSTVISQVFDSLVVSVLFFYVFQRLNGNDEATLRGALVIGATGYVLKFCIAVIMTPVIYLGRWAMKRWLKLEPIHARAWHRP